MFFIFEPSCRSQRELNCNWVSLAKRDGTHWTCKHRGNSFWEMSDPVLLWLVSLVMKNTPPAAEQEPAFLSSSLSFDSDLHRDHCKLQNPQPRPPSLDPANIKHSECTKNHSRWTWEGPLVHDQPAERFSIGYITLPGSCLPHALTEIYLL